MLHSRGRRALPRRLKHRIWRPLCMSQGQGHALWNRHLAHTRFTIQRKKGMQFPMSRANPKQEAVTLLLTAPLSSVIYSSRASHLGDCSLEHYVLDWLSCCAQHGEHHHQHVGAARSWVSGEVEHSLEPIPVIHSKRADPACWRQEEHQRHHMALPLPSEGKIRDSKMQTQRAFASPSMPTGQAAQSL